MFVWIHTIWICNRKNLLLSFHDFIFHHPSPIILLFWSCHLCYLYLPYFFNLMTSFPLSMLRTVGILLEIHAISRLPLLIVRGTLDGDFSAPEVARLFDWWERGCLLSPNPDVIYLLPFLLLPSTCFNMSQLMGMMPIERSETSVETFSSNISVAKHVTISLTLDYVLYMWWFSGNIIALKYFRSCTRYSLTSGFQIDMPFDSCSIAYLWENTWSPSKSLGFMVSESKIPSI